MLSATESRGRGESLKCGSTRAAQGRAALRTSTHLFRGWLWRAGRIQSGEVKAAGRGTISTVPWAQGRATLQNLKLPGRGEHAG